MNEHNCDIDFEKHTPFLHVKLLLKTIWSDVHWLGGSELSKRRLLSRHHSHDIILPPKVLQVS